MEGRRPCFAKALSLPKQLREGEGGFTYKTIHFLEFCRLYRQTLISENALLFQIFIIFTTH